MMANKSRVAIVKGFLSTLVVIAVLLGSFLFWLLGTTSGLRWAVNLAPNIMTVESINGDASNFSFNRLQLNLDGTTILIAQGSLAWRPLDLLRQHASVERISFTGVDIELVEAEPTTSEYAPWQGLEIPIGVSLDQVEINRISVQSVALGSETLSPLFALTKIVLSADIDNSVLTLNELKVGDSDKQVSLIGKIDLSAKPDGVLDLSHTVDWQIEQMNIESNGLLSGTWSSINIEQNQIAPVDARLTAVVNNPLSRRIEWTADLKTAARGAEQVMGETVFLGSGEFKLNGHFLPEQGLAGLTANIIGQTSIASAKYSNWNVAADVSLLSDDLSIDRLSLAQQKPQRQKSPANLILSGQVNDLTSFLDQDNSAAANLGSVDINAVWSSLAWPLALSADSSAAQVISGGKLSVTGSDQRYAVVANATGKAYGQDLKADMNMLLNGSVLEVEKLLLVAGKSRLSANGKIDDRLNLSWSIASPDIGDFLADGSGPLTSTGKVTGLPSKPRVSIKASSKGISFAGFSAEDLDLSAVASLANANDALEVSLQASSIRQEKTTIASLLSLNISGQVDSHSISLESTLANNATLNIRAKGSLLNAEWTGVLSRLDLNDTVLAEWTLKNDVTIEVANGGLSMSESCLINQSQALCFEANMNPQSTNIAAALTALDLANLNRFLQLYDLNIEGQANGVFSYIQAPNQASATIDGYLESTAAVLTWQESGDDELSDETLVFESIRASIKQVESLQGSVDVILANADVLTFNISVDQAVESPTFMQAKALGRAKLAIADLSILPTVLLDAVSLNGALNADLELTGSLLAPEIVASGELKNARADIPELGLQLEGLELNVTSDGTSKIDLHGQLRSGSGALLLSGNVDFVNLQSPKVTLVFAGENIQLADTLELNVVGDIDLTAKLENETLDLRGGVVIDRADLDFKLPETAVLVSNDVVLVGAETRVSSLKQRLKVTVDLGDKTNIRAQGLDANLLGKLLVFQEPGGILRGEGQITVNNGRYQAYGQDLKIDKGRLVFDGGSIDDPSLDLKAEKTVDWITAGVSVSGRVSAPRLNLYSTPSMQDEDIMSVLIFNKPLGKLRSQDGFTLLRIANSLRGDGTNEVTRMTEKLQQSLGLTSLEFQLTNNAPSVVAGKQLSSKLYIGYGYGLLDAAQSLILRYNLNEDWSVKADLGVNSGADLRYQIER
ncbi:MAG: translocation and assembly module TamB [Arenicella sp.]|jgi:translocation and assembly module TamB